ncbi:hypothetical protein ABTY98_09800 [Streptomyces sp. NPDC096040]|uniref:hypothetical protein n=1 Tax=Streptomyces sp. NPDC096040 TaxID=3155541 RepID=UPI003325C93D
MVTCFECKREFDVEDERDEYESYFNGELDYDEDCGGEPGEGLCAGCGIVRSEGLINQGRAIFMMNGDEDYDDDFAQKWL